MFFALVSAFAQDPAACAPDAECGPIILPALEKAVIDAVIHDAMKPIRGCYNKGLAADPTLAGLVKVRFVIAADGMVSSATTKQTTLGAPGVESCLNENFLTIVFPPPKGGGTVNVTYPFVFLPDIQPGDAVVSGYSVWKRKVIDEVKPVEGAATVCSAPDASRSVRFVITEAGTVEDLRLVGKPTPEEEEEACVRKVFASAHFTSPGERMAVYYAMVTAPR